MRLYPPTPPTHPPISLNAAQPYYLFYKLLRNRDIGSDLESARADLRLRIDHLEHAYAAISWHLSSMLQQDWSTESVDFLQIPAENKILVLSMAKTRLGLIPTVFFDDMIDG
ncbi:hypothetical protein CBS11232_3372 [Aspergillus niger]|nr:hypothetical protein CBS11232_3372 [Aspergillus niger]KAI2889288.1 hypothetical protein CBS11852_6818 [Aspergillus niger]